MMKVVPRMKPTEMWHEDDDSHITIECTHPACERSEVLTNGKATTFIRTYMDTGRWPACTVCKQEGRA